MTDAEIKELFEEWRKEKEAYKSGELDIGMSEENAEIWARRCNS